MLHFCYAVQKRFKDVFRTEDLYGRAQVTSPHKSLLVNLYQNA